ncbi:MAG: hypothetical protein LBK01_00405 [Burkholderiaceae bacterium]|jgi:hypothetical protein|nr:hypothetical protein [Burkholderiaceae bacterium]
MTPGGDGGVPPASPAKSSVGMNAAQIIKNQLMGGEIVQEEAIKQRKALERK